MSAKNPYVVVKDREFNNSSVDEFYTYLTPARNFRNVKITGLVVEKIESHHMCFTYCTFTDCVFSNSQLERVDFEGCLFFGCKFGNMSFNNSDVKTSKFVKCVFENSSFSNANFTRNQFVDTVFKRTNLDDTVFIENRSSSCKFIDCDTSHMSASLNEYEFCSFVKFSFTNGTFAYQILWECEFEESVIGWATIGITYGLTKENLQGLKLVHYFSELAEATPDEVLKFIIEQFEESADLYRALVVSAFHSAKRYSSLAAMLEHVVKLHSSNETPVRHEEVAFLGLIIKHEHRHRGVPLLTLQSYVTLISNCVENEWSDFHQLRSFLIHLIESIVTEAEREVSNLMPEGGDSFCVRFVFREKPVLTIMQTMESLVQTGMYETPWYTYEEKEGSFIEIFTGAATFLVFTYTTLRLVNYNVGAFAGFLRNLRGVREEYALLTVSQKKLVNSQQRNDMSKIDSVSLRLILNMLNDYDVTSAIDDQSDKLETVQVEKIAPEDC